MKTFCLVLKKNIMFVLIPIVFFATLFGAIFLFTRGTSIDPFVYAIF